MLRDIYGKYMGSIEEHTLVTWGLWEIYGKSFTSLPVLLIGNYE